jgi:adenylate kinase
LDRGIKRPSGDGSILWSTDGFVRGPDAFMRPRVSPEAVQRPVALTGTPGTGKSAVADHLASRFSVIEVAVLARLYGAARRSRGSLVVDMNRLRKALQHPGALDDFDLVVGHLAHLLPVREVIVLRCHPLELVRRLRHVRGGDSLDHQANFVAEAIDEILGEALGQKLRVFELDTTGRSIDAVAATVSRRLRRGGPPRWGRVDWLRDANVTAHLLDGPP